MEQPDDNITPIAPRAVGVLESLATLIESPRFQIPEFPVAAEAAAANLDPQGADLARAEEASVVAGFTRSQMADRAYRAEADRSERFRDHFELLAIFGLWSAAVAITAMASIWLLHMLLPASRRWLTTEDLSHIQSIVTAGLLVGVIGNHFKKRLN